LKAATARREPSSTDPCSKRSASTRCHAASSASLSCWATSPSSLPSSSASPPAPSPPRSPPSFSPITPTAPISTIHPAPSTTCFASPSSRHRSSLTRALANSGGPAQEPSPPSPCFTSSPSTPRRWPSLSPPSSPPMNGPSTPASVTFEPRLSLSPSLPPRPRCRLALQPTRRR
jgi:hypothetical protein